MKCAHSEDSGQSEHTPSLFSFHCLQDETLVISCELSARRACADEERFVKGGRTVF